MGQCFQGAPCNCIPPVWGQSYDVPDDGHGSRLTQEEGGGFWCEYIPTSGYECNWTSHYCNWS